MKWLALIWKKTKGIFLALICLLILFKGLIELERVENLKNASRLSKEQELPLVSVSALEKSTTNLTISVLTRVRPKHRSDLFSQSEGAIVQFNAEFVEGSIVNKGDILIALEDNEQKSAVALARLDLSEAKLALMTEERQASQARRDWERSKVKDNAPSALLLREPQLETARLRAKAAEAALQLAERQLSFTKIRAPFKGVVVSRFVHPGGVLSMTQPVAQIMSIDEFEIVAQLTESQWKLLAEDWASIRPTLEDIDTGQTWFGDIRSAGNFFDETTQLRNIYLTAKSRADNQDTLLPGKLVRVTFAGERLENVFSAPVSAYTQDAHVWLVGNDERLQKHSPDLIAVSKETIFFELPNPKLHKMRIAINPQASFTLGKKVQSQVVRSEIDLEQDHLVLTGIH